MHFRFIGALAAAGLIAAIARLSAQTPAPAPVTLRVIVVDTVAVALGAVQRLKAGEPFETVARQLSLDPSADDGGLIGTVVPTALRPEIDKVVRGRQVGELTNPIRIPTGFALFKLVAPEEAASLPAARLHRGLTAIGSVKYVVELSGLGEARAALETIDKPPDWELDPLLICEVRTKALAFAQATLEQQLAPPAAGGPPAPPPQAAQAYHLALGQLHAYQGRMDRMVESFDSAQALAAPETNQALRLHIQQSVGIAHLHKATADNGVFRQPGDRCLLPLQSNRALANTAESEKAIAAFRAFLQERPDDLEVKWLLNLAYTHTGGYPAQVPAAHLVPASAFASAEDVGRFVDVAPQAGLASFASAGGVIVDDFTNDGRLDIVTSNYNTCGPLRFFTRNADGTFTDRAAEAGLANQLGGLNLMQADYNNDACTDILVLRGGWDVPQRKSLLRNNCNGTFTDVTMASGLGRPATSTQTAVWTDINNDGFLDLFVGNESSAAQLFVNRRDGTFEDVAVKAGVARRAFTKGVTAGDYDNDGWPDLYVSNLNSGNFLYHNNRDGTFTDVTRELRVPGSDNGFATWFFDYDNDGWLDLFTTSYFTSVEESLKTYVGGTHYADGLRLYRNRGDGTFVDATLAAGLNKVYMPMGANYGDIDNDGFLDIYMGTGNPSYASLVPSVLLRNRQGRTFVDVTTSSGTGELHKGHGVAFADLDNDGDDEIVFEVGGATPGDAHAMRLFRNPGHGNGWLDVTLTGVKSNKGAVGARLQLTVEDADGARRTVHRTVGSGGSFGASPLRQHFGLGRASRIVELEVWWPTSAARQRFTGLTANRSIAITEFAPNYTTVTTAPLPLGGAAEAGAR